MKIRTKCLARSLACIAVMGCAAHETPVQKKDSLAKRSTHNSATEPGIDELVTPQKVVADEETGRYGPKIHLLPPGCGPAGGKFSCNPLTNAGCRAADGEACDDDDDDAFACFSDSDRVKEGARCNDRDGPACEAGLTCDTISDSDPRGICRKFCCSSNDCQAPRRCSVIDRQFGALGLCKSD
jgi:hypothetical protein